MPVPDYTNQYNTQLTPLDEAKFQKWLANTGKASDLYDYDLRGAWLAGASKDPRGHLTDKFKKPNHPTFSTESIYSSPTASGGVWAKKDGKWIFDASPINVQMYGPDALKDYFSKVEPDSTLVLPPQPVSY